ncbi:DUF4041 domain-containing protein [Aquitalea pelogenes]|uniref:DUF4041 domain-containing protein n=1 Tax=Aquitalea pelogenes TaxID=1293573 RepID=UPI0035B1FCC8
MEALLLLLIAIVMVMFWQRQQARKQLAAERAKTTTTLANWEQEWQQHYRALENALEQAKLKHEELENQIAAQQTEINSLARFQGVRDIDHMAQQLRQSMTELEASTKQAVAETRRKAESDALIIIQNATQEADTIRTNAKIILRDANIDAQDKRQKIDAQLALASQQAEQIIRDANNRAEQIAGDAYIALSKAKQLEDSITAMKNVIEGYGDRYLKPTYSLLDELADSYGFDEAGQQLKQARERSKLMVEHSRAATCDYVERQRKLTAIRFVLDAFNGKVDSILSRAKVDNFGILEQQIKDACALVNNNGSAFRGARITPAYLDARLTELKWLTAVNALREQDKEEQRRIREQIREEEKARREIERALKEAAKEEETLHRAMEKARAQVAKATEAQRAELQAKLAELEGKLQEAEARNQRALSMAQQTKAGHVYVISNIGSFGEHVYKVGMTRRLEPLERVKELGDASVPFPFDVHAMIWCEDAPALEYALHKRFAEAQVNKVNPRKEFFRLPLQELRQVVAEHDIDAAWTMTAKAAEYRESLAIEQELKENPATVADWLQHQEREHRDVALDVED